MHYNRRGEKKKKSDAVDRGSRVNATLVYMSMQREWCMSRTKTSTANRTHEMYV